MSADNVIYIKKVLTNREFNVVFQPVVDLKNGKIFSYEALLRSTNPVFKSPPEVFDAAVAAGCCGELGRVVRDMAVQECPGHTLFLNIHPAELGEGWLVRPDDPIFQHEEGIYLEVTESVPLSHFDLCDSILREVRSKGINLAVDDLGAGYSNLKYIADLAPEIVKIDRALVTDLHLKPRQKTLVAAIVRLCEDLNARVVAEGIETLNELAAVTEAGCHFGQGYLLARPQFPPPDVPWPPEKDAS